MTTEEPIVLKNIDPKTNRARIYRITNSRDLFGELCLLVEWGRLGRRLRSRLEPFNDDAARDKRKEELVAIRQRHGYTS